MIQRDRKTVNIFGIITGSLIAISVFLPYVGMSFLWTSINASLMDMDGFDGYLFLGAAALGIIFSISGIDIVVILSGIVSMIFFIIENSSIDKKLSSSGDYAALVKTLVDKKVGFYFLLIGSLGMIVAGIIGFVMKKKE